VVPTSSLPKKDYEEAKKMRVLQKILFSCVMVVGLSVAVFAQKDDPKKKPPKQDPPVITPAPTKPPPKKDDKKKSFAGMLIASKESLSNLG